MSIFSGLAGALFGTVALLLTACSLETLPAHGEGIIFPQTPASVETEVRNFTLEGQAMPGLIIHDPTGFIHVESGNDTRQMHIMVTKSVGVSGDPPSDLQVDYNLSNNILTIQVTHLQNNLINDARADIDVLLPKDCNLHLQAGAGSITVTGIEGQMVLTGQTGSIDAKNVVLTDSSQLHTNVGGIHFEGSIRSGQYQFQTVTGDVNVALPEHSNFHVDASTTTGFIASDFSSITVQRDIVGASATGDTGSNPPATVLLASDTGSVSLHAAR